MRHVLLCQLLVSLLAIPLTASAQHHHSSGGGGLGGLGSMFGGSSSSPLFQPQHHQPAFQPQHNQPAFQPQHHQNNQPMFGGQNFQPQNRQGSFQPQNNFQPSGQSHQANRPVFQQPQNTQPNRPLVQQPQHNYQQPQNNQANRPLMQQSQNNQTNRPLVQQPQNNQANRPLMQQPQNNQSNRPLAQQPQNNFNSPLPQHHQPQNPQGSNQGNSNNIVRTHPGANQPGATGQSQVNRPQGTLQSTAGQSQSNRPISNLQTGAPGRQSPPIAAANTSGVVTHRQGTGGQTSAAVNQSALDHAKQAAAQKAQEKIGGNQNTHPGVHQPAIISGNANQATQQSQNVAAGKTHPGGSNTQTLVTGSIKPAGHGTVAATGGDPRKTHADQKAHEIAVKNAQQEALKVRTQSTQGSTGAKSVATNAKPGSTTAGNATAPSGQVGVRKISTNGQVVGGNSSSQQAGISPGGRATAGSQSASGKPSTTSPGSRTLSNNSKPTGTQSGNGTGSRKDGLVQSGSTEKARDHALSNLPKDKQETIKNKTAQNTSNAVSSLKPPSQRNGASTPSTINKTNALALTGDVPPVTKGQAVTVSKLLTDPDPSVQHAAQDLLSNQPLTQDDLNALTKASTQAAGAGNFDRVKNIQNLIRGNEQMNALTASVTGTPLLGGLLGITALGGGGGFDPAAGGAPALALTPGAQLATGILQIIDSATGGSLGLSSLAMGGPIAVVPEDEIPLGDPIGPLASLGGYCMSIQDNYVPDYQDVMVVPIGYTSSNVTTTYRPILGGQVEELTQTSEPLVEPVTEDEQKMFDQMYAGIDLDASTIRILEAGWQNSSAAKRRADFETFMSQLQDPAKGQDSATANVKPLPQIEPVTQAEQQMFQRMYADLELDAQTMKTLEEGWQNSNSVQRKKDYEEFMAQIASPKEANGLSANVSGDVVGSEEAALPANSGSVLAEQIVPITAVTHRTRYLRLANINGESVKLHLQYYTEDRDGQWNWFPQASGQSDDSVSLELDPGEVTDLEIDGWRLNASKVRIWGSSPSGREWKKFKSQELVLVPETDVAMRPAYLSDAKQTFCFTIK